jgi:hypothetical protein
MQVAAGTHRGVSRAAVYLAIRTPMPSGASCFAKDASTVAYTYNLDRL